MHEELFTKKTQKIIDLALREALQLGHNYIGPEHLLLAIVRHDDNLGSQALHDESEATPQYAMTHESLRRRIIHLADAERAAWLPPHDVREKQDPVSDLLGSLNNALPLLGKLGGALLEDLAQRLKKL